jgi:hypothetical protein
MLGINGESAVNAWSAASKVIQKEAPAPCASPVISFSGTAVSELNPLLGAGCTSITVTARRLEPDWPIEIQRAGVTLDLDRTVLSPRAGLPESTPARRAI